MTEVGASATQQGGGAFATRVRGLDQVLDGGFARGGLYVIAGPPGAGKTTLGNQIAYGQATSGAMAVYATVLAETHERMLVHLTGFDFFAPEEVARRVHYVSLYDELASNGLTGALSLLRRLVREQRATLLVIDGASLFGDFSDSAVEFRRFTSELHDQVGALGCTTVLLVDDDGGAPLTIGYQVDGVVALEDETVGLRAERLLRVVKLRGADPLRGRHHFAITGAGIEVFPRLETLPVDDPPILQAGDGRRRQTFGVAGLDDMLGGGLPRGSTTLLLGLPGTGKTIAGLHFLAAGAKVGKRGLIVGFEESPPRLLAKGDALGLGLSEHAAAGLIWIDWHPPGGLPIDAWAHHVLRTIDEFRPTRLLIDPINPVGSQALVPDRLPLFMSALTRQFNARGVGSVIAVGLRSVIGGDLEVPPRSFPATAENLILLRCVELRPQLRRLVSVLKVRDAPHDTLLREFVIGPRGIEAADTFESAEAVLSGVARVVTRGGRNAKPTSASRTAEGNRRP